MNELIFDDDSVVEEVKDDALTFRMDCGSRDQHNHVIAPVPLTVVCRMYILSIRRSKSLWIAEKQMPSIYPKQSKCCE